MTKLSPWTSGTNLPNRSGSLTPYNNGHCRGGGRRNATKKEINNKISPSAARFSVGEMKMRAGFCLPAGSLARLARRAQSVRDKTSWPQQRSVALMRPGLTRRDPSCRTAAPPTPYSGSVGRRVARGTATLHTSPRHATEFNAPSPTPLLPINQLLHVTNLFLKAP